MSAQHPSQSPHDEIELKWLLTPAGHQHCQPQLTALLGQPRVLEQENQFFDTPDRRLQAARVNLRLRCENGSWIVTCKARVQAGDGLHHHHEWEHELGAVSDPLSVALAHDLPAVVRDALAGQIPVCLGGFLNARLVWDEGTEEICLDATHFSQRVDHELEVETTDPTDCRQRWTERFTRWNVAAKPAELTKFARFLQTLA